MGEIRQDKVARDMQRKRASLLTGLPEVTGPRAPRIWPCVYWGWRLPMSLLAALGDRADLGAQLLQGDDVTVRCQARSEISARC